MRVVVSSGWFSLAAMILAYGVANLLQSAAAQRTTAHQRFDPALLWRLAGHRIYLCGIGCQILGFVLAFLARRDLPLFLVQASVAAGLGVTALLGVLLLKWSLPRAEIVLLTLLLAGITALVVSARPGISRPLGPVVELALAGSVLVVAAGGFFAARLRGVVGSVVLGSLAGVDFSAAAIAARPLANTTEISGFFTTPLLYLLIVHSLVGQLLLGLAMQRGSTTAAVAAMDAAGAVPAAIVGLLLLGDRLEPGLDWLGATGFVLTLGAVIGLTRYAEPQHDLPIPDETVPDQPDPERPDPEQPFLEQPAPEQPAPGRPIPGRPIPGQPAPASGEIAPGGGEPGGGDLNAPGQSCRTRA